MGPGGGFIIYYNICYLIMCLCIEITYYMYMLRYGHTFYVLRARVFVHALLYEGKRKLPYIL